MTDTTFDVENDEFDENALSEYTTESSAPVSYTHLTLPTICSV